MTESIYDGAWRALTGRDEPWGGCARREEVERIVQFARAAAPDHQAEAGCQVIEDAMDEIMQHPNRGAWLVLRDVAERYRATGADHQAEAGCGCSCHTMGGSHVTPCCGAPAGHQAEAPSADRLALEARAWGEQYRPGMSQKEAAAFKRGLEAGWRDRIIEGIVSRAARPVVDDAAVDRATEAFIAHYGWQFDERSSWRGGVEAAVRAALGGDQ